MKEWLRRYGHSSGLLLTVLLPIILRAQVDTAWVRRYSGPGGGGDVAAALAIDNWGNVLVTGASPGSGTGNDYATVKYNSLGDTIWVRRYHGIGHDYAADIAVDDSGNVYVTGRSWGSGAYDDYATIKYNSRGDTLWLRRYNGPGNQYDVAYALAIDGLGNVLVTGASTGSGTGNDCATVKYNSLGDTIWVRRYNGPGNNSDAGRALAIDDSGNIFVTGNSWGSGTSSDFATIKYNPIGDTLWLRRYNSTSNNYDCAVAVAVDDPGNVYVTGYSMNLSTDYDYVTIKYNPRGDTLWLRRYNGAGNGSDQATALAVDDLGNVYVTGRSYGGLPTGDDYATIKYNSVGDTVWVRRYNRAGMDLATSLGIDGAGSVYVTGHSGSGGNNDDYVTVKYTSAGDTVWVATYNGPGNNLDVANALAVGNAGSVYVTGYSVRSGTDYDYATIKYIQRTGVKDEQRYARRRIDDARLRIYPNPFRSRVTITLNGADQTISGSAGSGPEHQQSALNIYDATGRLVRSFDVTSHVLRPTSYVSWNGRDDRGQRLPAGVYMVRFTAGEHQETHKVVVVK